MNFSNLRNALYLTFLSSGIINITSMTTELSLTGGGNAAAMYLILQTLIFGFALRSIFIGILYDFIVTKVDPVTQELKVTAADQIDRENSFSRTQKNSPALEKRESKLKSTKLIGSPMKSPIKADSEFSFNGGLGDSKFKSPARGTTMEFSDVVKQAMSLHRKDVPELKTTEKIKYFLTEKYKV